MRGSYIIIATGLFATVWPLGCANRGEPAHERERFAIKGKADLVIGAPWPWSARRDLLYGQGLQLALEQANAEGGIAGRKLKLEQVDDGGAVDRARLVAQQLVDDPTVVAVIGHHQSHVTAAAAPIYELGGVLLISATSTIPNLASQNYRLVFQTPFTGVDVGHSMAELALQRGCRRLAIYYSREDHGRALANAFEEYTAANGGRLIARESTDAADPAATAGVARVAAAWRSLPIDAVFLATPHKPALALALELRNQGFDGALFGSDALAAPAFVQTGRQSVEGTVFATAFSGDGPSREVQAFTRAFEQRFGKQPDVTAALGYDAVRVLVHAMRGTAAPTPANVAESLRGTREWPGVTGDFSFSNAGVRSDATVNAAVIRAGQARALDNDTALPTCQAKPALRAAR